MKTKELLSLACYEVSSSTRYEVWRLCGDAQL